MNALADHYDELDLDTQVSFRRNEMPTSGRELSSKSRLATQARFSRRKTSGSCNGAHRRRNKRNGL